jgi:hypothetical protein
MMNTNEFKGKAEEWRIAIEKIAIEAIELTDANGQRFISDTSQLTSAIDSLIDGVYGAIAFSEDRPKVSPPETNIESLSDYKRDIFRQSAIKSIDSLKERLEAKRHRGLNDE